MGALMQEVHDGGTDGLLLSARSGAQPTGPAKQRQAHTPGACVQDGVARCAWQPPPLLGIWTHRAPACLPACHAARGVPPAADTPLGRFLSESSYRDKQRMVEEDRAVAAAATAMSQQQARPARRMFACFGF